MSKKKKIILISSISGGCALLLIVCSFVLFFVAKMIYDSSFDCRCETAPEDAYEVSDFDGLKRERHTFKTRNDKTLVGYLYENADTDVEAKAVIVFAHGMGGGGQTGYMDVFAFMVSRGFYVFAYDATANDESEGEVIGGLPQGIIDLDYAISYAQTIDEIEELPFVLMGYSWGGLSVTNVLNYHPEVKAVVSLAGWNESINLIDYRGCQMVGPMAKTLLPFARVYEMVKYGKYAFSSSMKGFENSDCAVMIVHSQDDETVPIEYGYEKYAQKYADSDRFVFKKYESRGHDVMVDDDDNLDLELMGTIADFFDLYV